MSSKLSNKNKNVVKDVSKDKTNKKQSQKKENNTNTNMNNNQLKEQKKVQSTKLQIQTQKINNSQSKQKNKEKKVNQQLQQQTLLNEKEYISSQIQKQQSKQQEKQLTPYEQLNLKIKRFQQTLIKRQQSQIIKNNQNKDHLQNLQQILQYNNAKFLQKLEDLKRNQTFHLKLHKIQPNIPQNFPKNYHIQITYQDITFRTNPKFVDFDENIIDQKFIFPLLQTSSIKIQIIVPSKNQSNQQIQDDNQQNITIFDKATLSLQQQIKDAIDNNKKSEGQSYFEGNPQIKITHQVVLQGLGFQSWLKNIEITRSIQNERIMQIQQNASKIQKSMQKIAQRKKRFNKHFSNQNGVNNKLATKKYGEQEVNNILNLLKNDD